MPRRPRMYLPGVPAHIVQRGNNREACFFKEADFHQYLKFLGEALHSYEVQLRAYVLMTNHTHLCMTPLHRDGISRLMSLVGKNYVAYINRTYRCTGTLWEGRHKASLIIQSRYLLACMRYIELNPVRASMVKGPRHYRWSSFRVHALGDTAERLVAHPEYLALGRTDTERQKAYRDLITEVLPERDITEIRHAVHFNYPLGDERFRKQIEKTLKRSVGHDEARRPQGIRNGQK